MTWDGLSGTYNASEHMGRPSSKTAQDLENRQVSLQPSTVSRATLQFASEIFGNGADGDVTISSDTSLSRDMFYDTLKVVSTKALTTNGYRIFCKTLLVNEGIVENGGISGGSAGSLGGGSAAGGASSVGGTCVGGKGGRGGGVCMIIARKIDNSAGVIHANGEDGDDGSAPAAIVQGGTNGNAGTALNPGLGDEGNAGGAASAGAFSGTGGAKGALTNPTAAQGGYNAVPQILLFHQPDGTLIGGGTGGGGGAVAENSGTGDGAGAGGSGGGGGVLVIVTNEAIWGTETATGGKGGTGQKLGSGSVSDGGDGAEGSVFKFLLQDKK